MRRKLRAHVSFTWIASPHRRPGRPQDVDSIPRLLSAQLRGGQTHSRTGTPSEDGAGATWGRRFVRDPRRTSSVWFVVQVVCLCARGTTDARHGARETDGREPVRHLEGRARTHGGREGATRRRKGEVGTETKVRGEETRRKERHAPTSKADAIPKQGRELTRFDRRRRTGWKRYERNWNEKPRSCCALRTKP